MASTAQGDHPHHGHKGQEILCFQALIAAPHRDARPLWRSDSAYLYIDVGPWTLAVQKTFHRPLKKTGFWAIFAFDTPGPRTYNPRPRCFAALTQSGVPV